jgi:nucleotide-binding universal stress UspA family protein
MLKQLLVSLDGTPEAASVLPTASTLAHAVGAGLHLVRVVPEHRPPAANVPELLAVATQYLDRVAAEVRQETSLVVDTAAREGEPSARIVEEVLAAGADLVVMATHGRSGLQRAMLGSVAERTLAHSTVPVLLQRPGGRHVKAIRTLLVPVDGSPGGALALGTAVALAHATRARIVLVQVVVPLALALINSWGAMAPTYIDPAWDEEALHSAQGYVTGLANRLQRVGIDAEGRVEQGQRVEETIIETADQVDADIIVMSTHALTGVARAVLGSVADALVRTAGHPVLLLRQETAARLVESQRQAEPLPLSPTHTNATEVEDHP